MRNKKRNILVITSGYFDPLHLGHIEYFNKSKKLGTKLLVIVNSDKQGIMKKGGNYLNEASRRIIIQNLKAVDVVFPSIDKDLSVCKSLEQVADIFSDYDKIIFANGGDRKNYEIPEFKTCERLGIEIIDGQGEKIDSSSRIVREMKNGK
jgi:cytidyltransferase-like protein